MLHHTIKKLHNSLREQRITVQEVLKECIGAAKHFEELNAYISMNPYIDDQASQSEKYICGGKPRSILEGIPVAVKDNFCIRDLETTCGSEILKGFYPKYTATVVEKLFQAGAVLIGKTNLDEFAMGSGTVTSSHGSTKNIWGSKYCESPSNDNNSSSQHDDNVEKWYISGGSSGGSAVAVASGTCLGALGSDTGGSCRNPASYCGIVGLKPTYGLCSRYGLIPLVNSMDVPGILTLNVEDAAILLGLIAGVDEKDSTTVEKNLDFNFNLSSTSVKDLKVGIPVEYNCEELCDEVKSAWIEIAQVLEAGGAKVRPVSMPHTKYSIVCYSILNQCEVASNMARYDGIEFGCRSNVHESAEKMIKQTRSSGFNEVVRSRILAGNYFLLSSNYEKYFIKALKVRRLIAEDFRKAWRKGFQILLTPTTLTDAPTFSEYFEKDERQQSAFQDYCTQPANMAGCPAISIPIKLSKKGLPLSLQLMAPNFEEKTLLEAAHYIENAVNFAQHRW